MADDSQGTETRKKRPTFERVRFDLRPAKSIERKMLCELFRRLSALSPLDRYRYVGMGSTYFSDFSLFHKALGIEDMVSIEREVQSRARFEFNCPYRCVRFEFGESTSVLSRLTWEAPTILWLDYDGKLTRDILGDIKHAAAKAGAGSVLTVTVNAHPDQGAKATLRKLKDRVGEDKIPIDVKPKALLLWGLATVCRRIVVNEIEETLRQRNAGLKDADRLRFKQLVHFHYRDTAYMMTVGGILYQDANASEIEKCAFHQLRFFRDGAEACRIEVPCLTYREIRGLDTLLPCDDPDDFVGFDWLPSDDVKSYALIYRYFPIFTETEM